MTKSIPSRGTALLLIDVINDLAFPGAEELIARAEVMAGRLAALRPAAASLRPSSRALAITSS